MPITVNRLSDGASFTFEEITPETKVKVLKEYIYRELTPAHPKGCRLIFAEKVLKSRKKLKRYDVLDGSVIEMDDTGNWSDASSTSGSETD